jgi:nucleoid DNA-binding protein
MEVFFYILAGHLMKGHTITIRKLGTFYVREMPSHKARNIQTGEVLNIPSRQYVHFKASPTLKAMINGEKEIEPVTFYEEDLYDSYDQGMWTTW